MDILDPRLEFGEYPDLADIKYESPEWIAFLFKARGKHDTCLPKSK